VRQALLAFATTVAFAAVVAASAHGATVELRVGGSTEPAPLFAGSVVTSSHSVDGGDGSGPHACSGPAGAPAATATGALDDAMREAGIPWRGDWDPSFRDFFIDSIGPYASVPPDRYWSLTVNGRFASGGCLAAVADGDLVEFRFGSLFGAAPAPVPAPGKDSPDLGPRGGEPVQGAGAAVTPAGLRWIARRAARFLRRNEGAVGAEWGRLALAVRGGRGVPAAAAALLRDRLGELAGGSFGGDVNAAALALLAFERRSPRAATRAARWLVSAQDPSGGFGYRAGIAPDVDSTGLAVWALARAGRRASARRGAAFIRSAQADSGGFPALPGGDANAQSTGFGLVGLRATGAGPGLRVGGARAAVDFLTSLARPSGAIAYTAETNPTPAWTTAQALLGLTSREKLLAPPGG